MRQAGWQLGFLMLAAICTGCGGSQGQPSGAVVLARTPVLTLACAAEGGQQVSEPYFPGQNLQCSAAQNGSVVQAVWATTSGSIDGNGQLTHIDGAGAVTVSAVAGNARGELKVNFAWPVGAPGLVFATATDQQGPMWEVVVGTDNRVYGGGWSNAPNPAQAVLYSMDFWSRQVVTYQLGEGSMLSAAASLGGQAVFGGSRINATISPLVIRADAAARPVNVGECPQPGMLTALAYDNQSGILWGAWNTDAAVARVTIDPQSLTPDCSAVELLEGSADAPITSPWTWSLHPWNGGTVASGHFTTAQGIQGFVVVTDANGNKQRERLFPGLLDIRVSAPVAVDGSTFLYAAGHDISAASDVWTVKKLDTNLNELWTRTWAGNPAGRNQPYALAVGADSGVIVAGMSSQAGGGDITVTDAVIFAYAADGTLVWAPTRFHIATGGNDSSFISSLRFTPDHRFLVAAGGGSENVSHSFVLGFAMPE